MVERARLYVRLYGTLPATLFATSVTSPVGYWMSVCWGENTSAVVIDAGILVLEVNVDTLSRPLYPHETKPKLPIRPEYPFGPDAGILVLEVNVDTLSRPLYPHKTKPKLPIRPECPFGPGIGQLNSSTSFM